ncbi:hypothetical protein V496_08115 [Pseudogymnoascus sp. VKM F-4515 (FW-2607)]|nr:hypothetical protein V496_08115 [Pseudogymnoascus sp. VKM F-4515 (FW-2607)]KFY95199.1 hypothetical protein V498_03497 [Pseudogymnoascus sp. VKM F-4517 (FW-2822)]
MAPSAIAQRRTHNLLLFQKLLNLRDGASPFTLLLDTLEQPSQPVVREFITRAKIAKSKVIYVSFQTLKSPAQVDVVIRAHGKPLAALKQEILTHLPPPPSAAAPTPSAKAIVIIDTLYSLAASASSSLPSFLSSFLFPGISLVATYHLDIPLTTQKSPNPYAPSPLTTLSYLATSILRISSLDHAVQEKRARDRSLPEPTFGLHEGRDGVVIGRKSLGEEVQGVVVEMEIRRKSGRGVREVLVLAPSSASLPSSLEAGGKMRVGPGAAGSKICLLDDHPLYAAPEVGDGQGAMDDEDEEPESTFSLGLTEKQKKDREGVVLPYFDAQSGGGDGGRILYEMGREDDWDPEEDEI